MPGVESNNSRKGDEGKEPAFHQVNTLPRNSITDGTAGFRRPYQRLMYALNHDQKLQKEVSMGRRVGFYRIRGDLGSGNFSQVKVAMHDLCKERVAMKIVDKSKFDEKIRRMIKREISAMNSIFHPNIIRLYEVLETYSHIYLVLEYANGGELFNRITTTGRFPESDARLLFAQIASAVNYMHDMKFIHRDIKAENVFLSSPNVVKIGDFGFSIELNKGHEQLLTTFCGSPPYAAPELFRDDSYIGAPVDIWALGVLLYFMVSGQMPFKAQTVASLKKHITDGVYSIPSHVSGECKALIEGILKQSPQDRLSLSDILNSEWLKTSDSPKTDGLSEKFSLVPTVLQPNGNSKTVTKSKQVDSDDLIISDIELKAHAQLNDLGITEKMLEENIEHGVKSAIIGTYRIIVHQLQGQLLTTSKLNIRDTHASGTSLGDTSATFPSVHKLSFRARQRTKIPSIKQTHSKGLKNSSKTCNLL